MRNVLITGTAGFIGFHLARLLLDEGFRVQGYDGMSDYYDVRLKQRRHRILLQNPHFAATEALLEDRDTLDRVADAFQPDAETRLVHHREHAGHAAIFLADQIAYRAAVIAHHHGAGR